MFYYTMPTCITAKMCDDANECDDDSLNMCDAINGGCDNVAMSDSAPLGYTCTCDPGYELSADGFTCVDINECKYVIYIIICLGLGLVMNYPSLHRILDHNPL